MAHEEDAALLLGTAGFFEPGSDEVTERFGSIRF